MQTEVIDVEGLKRLSGNDIGFVSEILKLYTERTAKDLQELESARAIQDWNGVRFVVHRMRSAAVPLGLKELVVILRKAENQLREEQLDDIDQQLDAICAIARHALADAETRINAN
jgi:HPt (histidine-containing phosphotransfer) domain-containing protein